jgi:PAS domain S-box-containing protein
MSDRSSTKVAAARLAGKLLLFEAAFYLAYRYGMSFSHATASPFWFPDSVLLCTLLVNRPRRWWIFVLAPLPIRLFAEVSHGLPLWFLLATFAIDSAKGLVTAGVLYRIVKDAVRLVTVKDCALYGLVAILLVPAMSALVGATVRSALGYDFRAAWEQWFMGNALTHLVITPAILYWIFGTPWLLLDRSARRWSEGASLAAGLFLTSWLAFGTEPHRQGLVDPLALAPAPFLFWAAIRFGMVGASGAIAALTFFSVRAALHGLGPFAGETPAETARALQEFLAVRALALYLVAVLVHQMKSVERDLRESERRFHNLANSAPVLIWDSGLDGRLTFLNQVWLDYTGTRTEELTGSTWTQCVHPEERQHCLETYEASFQERREFTVECRLRRHDGVYRWVVCTGIPRLSECDEFLGYIGSCVDISDKKEADLEMRRLGFELAHANRMVTMGELTAAVAHELKQPLTAILSNAEAAKMLLDADPPAMAEVQAILDDIRADDQRAGEIIRGMRSLLGKHEVVRTSVEINTMLEDVFRLIKVEAAGRKVAMTLDTPREPPHVAGDRVQLQQVLMNLILNSFEAMADMPEVKPQLLVRARCDDRTVKIDVCDTGPGIPDERLPQLFEPFWTTKQDGLGMGLSITRTIVEAHGGRVWAENNPGPGATFRIALPLLAERST